MTWNWRVIVVNGVHQLCEVYYNEAGDIVGWCEGREPMGDDLADLIGELDLMRDAAQRAQLSSLKHRVLTIDDLPSDEIAVDAGEAVVSPSPGTAELDVAASSEQPPASTAPLHTDTAGRSAPPGSAVPCETCGDQGFLYMPEDQLACPDCRVAP